MSTTTLAITGNVFLVDRIARTRIPRLVQLAEQLRAADVTIANLESTIPARTTPPAHMAGSGWAATYFGADPAIIEDLRWFGIDMVTVANNHTTDFGEQGVVDTIDHLRAGAMPFAGIGRSLAEATAPVFVDARSGARVAVISASDWGPRGSMGLNMPWPVGQIASDELPPFVSRPGVNLLRYEAVNTVRRDDLETLRRLSNELGWDPDKVNRQTGGGRAHPLVGTETNIDLEVDSDTTVWFLGRRFELGDKAGVRTEVCETDVARMEARVRQARRQADIVCVALHDQSHGNDVHEYIRTFARRMIDAGADVYTNNGGTHKGIEFYRGRPVIYGAPSLLLQNNATPEVPLEGMRRLGLQSGTAADFFDVRAGGERDAKARGAGLATVFSTGGGSVWFELEFGADLRLTEIRLRPFEHAGTATVFPGSVHSPTHRQFLPLAIEPGSDVADRVLSTFVERSQRCGTAVEVRDGVGVVDARAHAS